ncbi:helix-turn-helix domain-containing protein [Porticoccaceae bacterium]|nr:helix-turn-helix domain-containing protein [Porticoccaceae bacterium]
MTPGNRLRQARMLNGFKSQKALSTATETMSRARVGRLERDESSPTMGEIVLLCKLLDMSADWLVTGDPAPYAALHKRTKALSEPKRIVALTVIDALHEMKN